MLRFVLPLLIFASSAFSSDLINSLLRPTKVAMINDYVDLLSEVNLLCRNVVPTVTAPSSIVL